jgi:hypothetical protein
MHVRHARVYEAMTINIDGNGTKSLFYQLLNRHDSTGFFGQHK